LKDPNLERKAFLMLTFPKKEVRMIGISPSTQVEVDCNKLKVLKRPEISLTE
jgi:hypothetical protein